MSLLDPKGKTECLILGNGPSLSKHFPWLKVPPHVFVFGTNQSWRIYSREDAHIAVDETQWAYDGATDHARELYQRGGQTFLGSVRPYGQVLNIDHNGFSRDPGTKVYSGVNGRTSVVYQAIQIAAEAFPSILIAGMDMSDEKFTGEPSRSTDHDRVFVAIPEDVRERIRVIGPSATGIFQVVAWPWAQQDPKRAA